MAPLKGAPEQGTFGRLLRQYRQHAGLRQERLAERAGLSTPAISNLERGLNRPRLETVNLLAEALALTSAQRAELLAAAVPGGASAQPAVPIATRTRHNLPVPPTALLGREREVAAVRARLHEPAARLVTLVGVGGVGKTRLALAVGESMLEDYPDGVWLVELAPLADATLVPCALAEALGLREEPCCPLPATLANHIGDRRLLLLLDNCEHLLGACAELASVLLRSCPHLRILATSRERLGVSWERLYPVPPLSVPDAHHPPPPELVGSYEAVRLFVARARARRPDFALTTQNARAVAEICARLDGIPLALELAAARVGSLSVEAVAERLDERFGLLTTGPRDVALRQRTLQAAMDWSWDLLDEEERALLRRLSVFAGSWALAAAEEVCGGEGIEAAGVLDLLDGLAGKSLVQFEHADGEGARYRLLETVRQYAGERLAEAGELATVRGRHLSWCVALAEEAEPHLLGMEQAAWLARLDHEHANMRAALRWARERGAYEQVLRLAGALWRFWSMRGWHGEGRGWLDLASARTTEPAAIRARALSGAGNLAYDQGDYRQAAARHEEALALRRELGDRVGIANSLNNLGNVTAVLGDHERGIALHEEALALRRELGDRQGVAISLNNLGSLAAAHRDYVRAAALHEEALALRRELGDRVGIANSLSGLGTVLAEQGEYARATALLEESLALRRALADKVGIVGSLYTLGSVLALHGGDRSAGALLGESLRLAHEVGARDRMAEVLEILAWMAVRRRQPYRAARMGGAAEALRQAVGVEVMPDRQDGHEQAVRAMRAALGEEVFEVAWAEGRAMALEEVAALALEDRSCGQ